jgi:hypothetical protein
MRPVANFTLHAILAAALAALATTSAAAGGPAILTLGSEGVGGAPRAAKSDKPRIAVLEIMAFEWGTAADSINLGSWSKADGLAVSWDVPDSAARVSKIDGFTVKQKAVEGSGLPTGKRQHKPFSLARPLDKGSVWIRVASPWADCRVGKRFPSLEISDGTQAHRLVNATVAGCGRTGSAAGGPTEEIAFTYNRISR